MDQGTLTTLIVIAGLLALASLVGLVNVMMGGKFIDGFIGLFREVFIIIGTLVKFIVRTAFSGCFSTILLLVSVALVALLTRA